MKLTEVKLIVKQWYPQPLSALEETAPGYWQWCRLAIPPVQVLPHSIDSLPFPQQPHFPLRCSLQGPQHKVHLLVFCQHLHLPLPEFHGPLSPIKFRRLRLLSAAHLVQALYALGALVLLMGAEGFSLKGGGKVKRRPHGQSRGKDAKMDTVDLLLDPTSMSSSVPLHQIGANSLSPWKISFTHDKNCFPPYIAEATCLLKGCLNAEGQEVMDFESKPIFHQILVLRRVEMDQQKYAYKLETKTISVGCTCVRPNVMQQK
ncbi:hypothetical protein SKAU_G00341280 [Synaphobranchus kaupii]|uniref:Interleukin-17F n=1 Tax=Synaphobranchus kaupii TaxID=118154 RepID=A0A9Q1IJ85_SYNKA|nr:hypothetical protein SKAU_G00341280 [Synaphobranchus kaupii]